MQTVTRSPFTSVKTEGGLLPADLLQRIADGDNLPGLRPVDYHLYEGERVNEAVNRAWNRCVGAWKGFKEQSEKIAATDSGTSLTRERWLLVLFQELGYGRLPALRSGLTAGDTTFPISHLWQATPIHLVTFRQGLDQRSEVSTTVKRSPHSLMQEFLNRSPEHQWGIIANGLTLRILRDNASLRRAAFVEFDLASIMQYELYAEFALLWMVCHQSRFEPFAETTKATGVKVARPAKVDDADEVDAEQEVEVEQATTTCWLEVWSKTAAERGTRAMDALRDGVKEAVEALGSGFLAHRENEALRAKLREGALRADSYYHQLRRMVYRLIFLAVAEDRDLLLLPETSADIKQLYSEHYSLRRLRTMSAGLRGGPHPDLHRQLRLLFVLLREGYLGLGLPGLGSFLFSDRSTPDLDKLELANQHLLAALRALSFTVEGRVRRAVDFRNLDSEELGSIYQSLLELHPEVNLGAATFVLNQGAGSERKTTGSHYTPTSLVESLLDTALEPVVADRLAKAEEQWRKGSARTPESLRQLQDDAILAIKVLDGATGSGHMLIGAGRRLARHLARIRTGEDEPSPEALRAAMRDVVRHCLYGVDLNDMAVELCKVALWMESLEPGKPLSFLDAHIQCGNSLIGVTPGLDIKEIPDDAFQPVTGDDKATATGLRRRNKKEREGQIAFQFGDGETPGSTERHANKRAQMVAAIEDLAEDGVAQVAAKEQSYAEYLQSTEYKWARWEADTWTAAFFWPMPKGDPWTMAAPTQEVLNVVRSGKLKRHEDLLKEVRRIAKQHQFFHWALQFPDVFQRENGGFDIELMNPPWDMLEISETEFFAARSPEISAAATARQRAKMISMLGEENPSLYREFSAAKYAVSAARKFVQSSKRFLLSSVGRINLYPLFVEQSLNLVNDAGQIGIIVPSAISTDAYNADLFSWIIEQIRLRSLFDFENSRNAFPSVDSRYRFCLLTLCGRSIHPDFMEFRYFCLDSSNLKDVERRIELTQADLELFSPNTLAPPILQNRTDLRLARLVYSRWGVLVNKKNGRNQWDISVLRMLSLSDPGDFFRSQTELASSQEGDLRWSRLYSGKSIHQFNHRYATYAGKQRLSSTAGELNNPHFFVQTEYYVKETEVTKRIAGKHPSAWLIGYRDICRATDERTAIASVIPAVGCDTHCRNIYSGYTQVSLIGCLVGNINSFVFDYFARQKVISTGLGSGLLEQLPVLAPSVYTLPVPFDPNSRNWVVPRVLELTYTAWDLQPFARDCGYNGPPFRWDEDRRFLLRCELDAAYFHLYGIERDDVDYIMETFPIVKRKDIARHGEYRTKRVILEMYDDMAAAMQGGAPYQTRLDPPAADGRVAHEG